MKRINYLILLFGIVFVLPCRAQWIKDFKNPHDINRYSKIPYLDNEAKIYAMMYIESGIEIILNREMNNELLSLLVGSNVLSLSEIDEAYIYKNFKFVDYTRNGENDFVTIESKTANEITLKIQCDSNTRAVYPGLYTIRIKYKKVSDMTTYKSTHITVNNLRVRKTPSLSADTISILGKGTFVQILEIGQEEIIDGIKSGWVKIMSDTGYQGWCFSGYLHSVN
jgi:hypothetical protein